MRNKKNILIVRTDRVGDVVLTFPMIYLLKKNIPDSNIFFMVSDYTKDLLEYDKNINELIILDKSFIKNYLNLKKYKIDIAIIASPNFILAFLFFLARIPIRVGTAYRWYSFFFNKRHFEHRKFGNKHELEYNFNLLKELNIDVEYNINYPISINEIDKSRVDSFIDFSGKKIKLITIHPGSGGSALDLPFNKMKELLIEINKIKDVKICLTGLDKEAEQINQLNSSINNNALCFINKLNLRELAYLIKKSKIFISNSTGPIHLAANVGTSIIGFYPPVKAMSIERWGPYTNKRFIFIPEKRYNSNYLVDGYCKKCKREKCVYYNCMNYLSIDTIMKKINELLITEQ